MLGCAPPKKPDDRDEAELSKLSRECRRMVQQQKQRHGSDEPENAGEQQNRLATDAVGQDAGRDHDRQQYRHAERIDLERTCGWDAVGTLQPTHEVDEADVEADRGEHRQAGETEDDAPRPVQRLDDRSALATLGRQGLQRMPAQKVTGDADHLDVLRCGISSRVIRRRLCRAET